MTVNLEKNKESMLKAWKEVVDDKCSTNWALYGYDKQTNDLKLVGTGDEGLEELAEDFNSGKMMYAFCRVIDPKTSLPKYVLINWQGEGAPTFRKGNCAHHIHEIKKFFKGAHIMVNARTEEEVEPEVIMEKVAKSTGSSYSFKERSSSITEAEDTATPVKSVYKRIQADSAIDTKERDKFWEQQEIEEKKRRDAEELKLKDIRMKQEQERKNRETKEAEAREELVKERSRSISEIRKAEKLAELSSKSADKEKWNKQIEDDMKDEEVRRKRSESLRQERNLETQQLIGQRTIDARAIFEQNTSAGQMNTRRNSGLRTSSESSVVSPSSPVLHQSFDNSRKTEETKVEKTEETKVEKPSQAAQDTPAKNERSSGSFSYTRNLLAEGLPPRQDSENEQEEESNWDEPPLEDPPQFQSPLDILKNDNKASNNAEAVQEPVQKEVQAGTNSISARALYDYQAADDTEISFDPDDIITNIDMIDEGWWQGIGPDGSFGLFPANYVEVIQ